MTLKPNGQQVTIREQIIEDPVSELTFQFIRTPSGEAIIRIFGNLPLGTNRELIFDQDGQLAGAGTSLVDSCPSWLERVG